MFFYECIPAGQDSCNCYATNITVVTSKISYHTTPSNQTLTADLHAKIDRVLQLLGPQEQPELVGMMDTREAAAFIAISKRTFERMVKQGLISPIANNMKKNRFSKEEVVRLYIAYRGYKPTQLP